MEAYKIVLPENLNHYGNLFGGHLLKWVDEYAYIAAISNCPGNNLVTIGMDEVHFLRPSYQGDILKFVIKQVKIGKSVKYHVKVFSRNFKRNEERLTFQTNITFVNIDQDGIKMKIERESD